MTKKLNNMIIVGALIALASILLAIESAAAQSKVCAPRDKIVERLEGGYQEFVAGMGLSTNGQLVELFKSDKGTWTILITSPEGNTCLVAAGEGWQTMTPLKSKSPVY
jgi:hypothetical protein